MCDRNFRYENDFTLSLQLKLSKCWQLGLFSQDVSSSVVYHHMHGLGAVRITQYIRPRVAEWGCWDSSRWAPRSQGRFGGQQVIHNDLSLTDHYLNMHGAQLKSSGSETDEVPLALGVGNISLFSRQNSFITRISSIFRSPICTEKYVLFVVEEQQLGIRQKAFGISCMQYHIAPELKQLHESLEFH